MKLSHTWFAPLALTLSAAAIGCAAGPSKGMSYPSEPPSDAESSDYSASADGYGQPGSSAQQGYPQPASPAGGLPPAPPSAEAKATAPRSDDAFDLDRAEEEPSPHRPGLATQWGERRSSRVSTAPFVRAERLNPFAIGKLFYNDPDGIAAMSDTRGSFRDQVRRFEVGSGHVEMGLRDGSGRFLTGFVAGGDNFVTGIAGHRYTIVLKNHSPGRIEAVVSVDGLDVIDGKDAAFTKRGYLLDPFGELEIDGFRTSHQEVAAFRFGSVESSYANRKHGNTRNVGVIGVALFHERGDSPHNWGSPHDHSEVIRRQGADPFPNRFATPPN